VEWEKLLLEETKVKRVEPVISKKEVLRVDNNRSKEEFQRLDLAQE
jgi:hypothetical protein